MQSSNRWQKAALWQGPDANSVELLRGFHAIHVDLRADSGPSLRRRRSCLDNLSALFDETPDVRVRQNVEHHL
jgi:hypothetical protein